MCFRLRYVFNPALKTFHGIFSGLCKELHRENQHFEPLVLCLAMIEPVVYLLGNAGKAKQAKAIVEIHIFYGFPGKLFVAGNNFFAGHGPFYVGGKGSH